MVVQKVVGIYSPSKLVCDIKGIGNKVGVQVRGIDTPEPDGKCKKEQIMAQEGNRLVKSFFHGAKKIELKNITKTNIIIADIYADGKSLSKYLLKGSRYALPLNQKEPIDWCM